MLSGQMYDLSRWVRSLREASFRDGETMPITLWSQDKSDRQLGVFISVSDKNKTTKYQEVSRVESLYDSIAQHYFSNAQNIDLTKIKTQ